MTYDGRGVGVRVAGGSRKWLRPERMHEYRSCRGCVLLKPSPPDKLFVLDRSSDF